MEGIPKGIRSDVAKKFHQSDGIGGANIAAAVGGANNVAAVGMSAERVSSGGGRKPKIAGQTASGQPMKVPKVGRCELLGG